MTLRERSVDTIRPKVNGNSAFSMATDRYHTETKTGSKTKKVQILLPDTRSRQQTDPKRADAETKPFTYKITFFTHSKSALN